jgi:hypothetical protein
MTDDQPEKVSAEHILKPSQSEIRDRIEALRVEKGYPPLPNVTLRVGPRLRHREDYNYTEEEATICLDGEPIGFCNLETYEQPEPQYTEEPPARFYLGYITTQRLRGQPKEAAMPREDVPRGVGLATYLLAIELAHERGVPFVSGTTPTDDAERIWGILSETGMVKHVIKRRNELLFPTYIIPPENQDFNDDEWGQIEAMPVA